MKRKRLLTGNAVPVLSWREIARADLLAIVGYIADDNPDAAQELKDEIEAKVSELARFPQMYKPGRVAGTREMVVRPNYIVVYAEDAEAVSILRVLHAAQQWP
jgi:addiction module RelE/StbE family toxin